MKTSVLVFEDEGAVCLKTLARGMGAIPFPIRIFPLLVRENKIAKRWALMESEHEKTFVEKEEKAGTIEEFLGTLKGEVCTIVLGTTTLETPIYFAVNTRTKELSMRARKTQIHAEKYENLCGAVRKSVLLFFKKTEITLKGIRVKNKLGKKETLETKIIISGAPHRMPSELEMSPVQEDFPEVKTCAAYVENKTLEKLLSKSPMHFTNGAFSLRLERKNSKITSTIFKRAHTVDLLELFQQDTKEQNNKAYLNFLVKKYGELFKPIAEEFAEKERPEQIAEEGATFPPFAPSPADGTYPHAEGVFDILNTLAYPASDRRSQRIALLRKMYEEAESKQREEEQTGGVLLTTPGTPSGLCTLQHIMRERRNA